MDVSLLIRHRLNELELDQKDLAAAAQVTESYISQLLTRKKVPPAPGRTDLYDRMSEFLRLPAGELSKLADVQRQEDLKERAADAAVQSVPRVGSPQVRAGTAKGSPEDFREGALWRI